MDSIENIFDIVNNQLFNLSKEKENEHSLMNYVEANIKEKQPVQILSDDPLASACVIDKNHENNLLAVEGGNEGDNDLIRMSMFSFVKNYVWLL